MKYINIVQHDTSEMLECLWKGWKYEYVLK